MTDYTPAEYTALLTRTFLPRVPSDNRPRAVSDVNEKGEDTLEYILPHPEEGRLSATLTAVCDKGCVTSCSLRFGLAEVAVDLEPEEALSAVEEIIGDNIVAIVRYKNRDAYDNHRKTAAKPSEGLYQLPDHEEALALMLEKLERPATFMEKLSGKLVGVFEVYRWSGSRILER